MGYGVNNHSRSTRLNLQPLQIPLGTATVAKATQNVTLQGALTPTGDIANTAQIVETGILTDGSKTYPQTARRPRWPDGSGNLITGGA